MSTAQFKYITSSGNVRDGELRLEDYKLAADLGMSVATLINRKYADADVAKYGTAFEQGMHSLGIYTKSDPERGIKAPTVGELLNGTTVPLAAGESLSGGGGIVAPSQQGTTPATRVFFPEVVLQMLQEKLIEDYTLEKQVWARMLSGRDTIDTEQFTQPMIDVTAPRSERGQPISQNALPKTMVSITTSQTSRSIRTESIGLQISDQALMRVQIDLLGIILGQQAEGQSNANLWDDINKIVYGNPDVGQGPLPATPFTSYDPAAPAGTVTQTGWLKFLYDPERKIRIDSILCDLDTYLKIQNRQGRPLVFDPNTTGTNTGNLGTYGLNVEPNLLNVSLGVPNVMVVPTAVIGADTIVGFDSRYAIREVVNASAEYSAVEDMVLQRSKFLRIDWGREAYRLYEEAFRVTTL